MDGKGANGARSPPGEMVGAISSATFGWIMFSIGLLLFMICAWWTVGEEDNKDSSGNDLQNTRRVNRPPRSNMTTVEETNNPLDPRPPAYPEPVVMASTRIRRAARTSRRRERVPPPYATNEPAPPSYEDASEPIDYSKQDFGALRRRLQEIARWAREDSHDVEAAIRRADFAHLVSWIRTLEDRRAEAELESLIRNESAATVHIEHRYSSRRFSRRTEHNEWDHLRQGSGQS